MQPNPLNLKTRRPAHLALVDRPQTSPDGGFLVFDRVSKSYPTTKGVFPVLENVNLTIQQGEFVCFIGHSGCGKSTLLSLVSGFQQATGGSVTLDGEPILKPGPIAWWSFKTTPCCPGAPHLRMSTWR